MTTNEELIASDDKRTDDTFQILLRNNRRLVKKWTSKYKLKGLDLEDIESIITTEMWRAYKKYDTSKKEKFTTFFGKYVTSYFRKEIEKENCVKRKAVIVYLESPITGGRDDDGDLTVMSITENLHHYDEYMKNTSTPVIDEVISNIKNVLTDSQHIVFTKKYLIGERQVDIAEFMGTTKKVVGNMDAKIKYRLKKITSEMGVMEELKELRYCI